MKHFDVSEFDCPCCGKNGMKRGTMDRFDLARDLAGVPFHINSGYRCAKHNKEVGGNLDSPHLRGYAADIAVSGSRNRWKIRKALIDAGFKRIGTCKDFLHADDDPNKDQCVEWMY